MGRRGGGGCMGEGGRVGALGEGVEGECTRSYAPYTYRICNRTTLAY